MTQQQRIAVVVLGVALLAGIARSWWLHAQARAIAERWLEEHKYRVQSLKVGLFGFTMFSPKLFRDSDQATSFRAVVEDRQLGGTGVVWLRVWTDRLGLVTKEPDIEWEKRPVRVDAADLPPEEQWEMAQRGLLRRVSRGETSFAAPRRPREGEMPFDELVEHLLAMQRRGLVACSLPRPGVRPGARYDFIEFVELTDEGRAYLQAFP